MQVEIEDMEWNESLQAFTYECTCGELFQITLKELQACTNAREGGGTLLKL